MLKRFVTLILCIIVFTNHTHSQIIEHKVWLDTNQMLIGDQIWLNLTVKATPKTNIYLPQIPDTIGKLEILQRTKIDTQFVDTSFILKQRFLLTTFDSGLYVIPSFAILYEKRGVSTLSAIQTDSLLLSVHTLEIDTTQDIKDIKPIIEIKRSIWEYWYVFAIAVGVGLIAYIVFLLLKRKKLAQLPPERKVPPHIFAFDELKKLNDMKLWQKGQVKEFHIRLTEIIRKYIELRFDIPALEMVSSEIIQALRDKRIFDEQALSEFNRSLQISDLVKFAKFNPLPDENSFCFDQAWKFVEITKPIEEVSATNQGQSQ